MPSAPPAAHKRPACQQHASCIDIVPRAIAAGVARHFTGDVLRGCDSGLVADAKLVVSELVTNAYQALCRAAAPAEPDSRATIRLGVQCAARWVRVYVTDPAKQQPVRRTASAIDERGRGLDIVTELASWWVTDSTAGKTVHAVLAAPGVVLDGGDLDRIASDL